MQSLPKFSTSQYPGPIYRLRNRSLLRERTQRLLLKCSWRCGGSAGSGGNGGRGGGEWFEYGDSDDFSSQNFDILAALTLISRQDPPKIPYYVISEGNGGDEEVDEKEAGEESGMPYVKPAPKPKPMSLSIQPGLSWMLMLLLVSGGFFLWRRSRNRNTAPQEEIDAEAVVQRLTENQTEAHLSQQSEPETQETTQEAERQEGGRTPDFAKDLEEQDALFGAERDVKIEKQPSGIESANPSEESLPPKTATPPAASEPPVTSAAVPPPPPVALVKARETETSIEAYNEDLDQKDAMFPDERMSEKQGSVSEPASAPDTQNPETIRLEFKYMETQSTKELEKEMCARWVLSPTSQIDEGSNQSAATNFSEARSLNTEAQEFDSPLSEKEVEDYDFEHLPKKYDLIEEDLGPPIKPTAVDFTQPASWELEAPVTKFTSATTDERTQTMQYLLSNAHLMAEALKAMESSSKPVDGAKHIPDVAAIGASKQPKKKKSKKKKSSAA